jgi:hypothetical protein
LKEPEKGVSLEEKVMQTKPNQDSTRPNIQRNDKPETDLILLQSYRPISYQTGTQWGSGHKIIPALDALEHRIWEKALPLQDQRGDPGHAELVTYFALQLSHCVGFDQRNRRGAVLAAIIHDTGYSQMENIKQRFQEAVLMGDSSDPEQAERGQSMERKIRLEHQEQAVILADRWLKELPDLPQEDIDEVKSIVGDHDTRRRNTTDAGKIMRDADYLYRVTNHCCLSIRNPALAPDLIKLLERWSQPKNFQTSLGFRVSRLEVANTVLFRFRPEQLSEKWLSDYADEANMLQSRHTPK